ncbi:hypothetical protein ACFL40_02615 [candidate division KSB1 bacterium]
MRWPGAVYDGEAAQKRYIHQIETTAKELGVSINIRSTPIHSLEEGEKWINEAQGQRSDGLFLVVHDRQEHSWPTAMNAIKSGIPTVVYSPVGTAFTVNTSPADALNKGLICSTDDFSQALYGMKMLKAGTKLRETKVVVLKGKERRNDEVKHFGTKLAYVPAGDFLDEYNRIPMTGEIKQMADDYIRDAAQMMGTTKQDVLNGIKSYTVAKNILEREKADAITMDCLGALGKSKISLPCISWSKMNDDGIPAACEADINAVVSHCLVQYLFDRPGFQQDPVPDSSKDSLIGSHCSCPTRLNGFSKTPEPYDLSFHHGKRDAVPKTVWKVGQKVTVFQVVLDPDKNWGRGLFAHRFPIDENDARHEMIISTGEVIENISVPPSGGCVVSINVKLDGVNETSDILSYPGFHQIFFYGDYKKKLKEYCRLFNLKPLVV